MSRTKIRTARIDQVRKYLKKLTIQDLVVFFEACDKAQDGVWGILNQPRTSDEAESLVEELLSSHLDLLKCATIKELQMRKPSIERDLELRNCCLALDEMRGGPYSEAVKSLLDIGFRPAVPNAEAAA
jgi:hypothetical protein